MRSDILPPHQVEALIGKFNLTVENETDTESHFVSEIAIHPEWKYNQNEYDADIAILVLAEAAGLNSFIRTVCLPSNIDGDASGKGTVVGWSAKTRSSDHYQQTPFELQQPVVDAGTCYPTVYKLSRFSSARMFCGGFLNQSTSTCTGDSGGGFYFFDGWVWTIRGIVSGGLRSKEGQCEVNAYTLYTSVAKFRDWITEVIDNTMSWIKVEFQCTKEYV